MADVIQLIITAKNDASKAITQVNKDISALQKSTGSVSNFDKTLSAVGTGLAVGAFAATVGMIVEGTAQLSQAGANVDRLRVSFEQLAVQNGTSGAQIIASIDAVTQGTLSNQQIMEQANAAMLLGVAQTGDEFATLAKIAVERGRAMGISMEYAFESIVKGVGRMSPLILDNLGIVIDADTTYRTFAETIGKTADELTDLEKRQALISRLKVEVADFDPDSVNDAASAWEKLAAATANAAAATGSWINTNTASVGVLERLTIALDAFSGRVSEDPATRLKGLNAELARLEEHDIRPGLADFLESMKQTDADSTLFGLPALDKILRDLNAGDIDKVAESVSNLKRIIAGEAKSLDLGAVFPDPEKAAAIAAEMEAAAADIKMADEYAKQLAAQMGEGKDEAAALVGETIKTAGSLQAAIPALNALIDGFRQAKEDAAAMVSAINGATSGFRGSVMDAFIDSGYNQDVIEAAKLTQVAFDQALVSIENAGYSLYDTEAAVAIVEEQFSSSFTAISDSIDEATKSTGGAIAKTAQLSEEYRGLQGIVQGLLSAATQDIGGLDLSSILPREDAISENARRLAAIANEGLIDQPWLEEFKNEAPGVWTSLMLKVAMGTDTKIAAAQLLQDFQNGLRPELIDKGKLKEIAKRMFMVDQSTKAMIDEIATELANEMGISIEDAKSLVGSAAGVKKVLTDEEKQAIVDEQLTGLEAKIGFKFGDRNDTVQAGIDQGFLNSDGKFEVGIAMNGDANSFINSIAGASVEPKFDKDGLEIPPETKVSIPASIAVDQESVTAAIEAIVPDGQSIKVPLEVDTAGLEASAMNAFSVWANAFVLAENVAIFSDLFATTIDAAILEQETDLFVTGYNVGVFVMRGFKAQNTGLSMATEIAAQLSAAQGTIEASGQATGKLWGSAMLATVSGNVPMQLINVLTDLITPEVLEAIRVQNGLTGAN